MSKKITCAAILCGGKGTRLGSITKETPKPLVALAGKPFLTYLLEWLSVAEIRTIHLLAGHLGNKITAYVDNLELKNIEIKVINETALLGTGGAVLRALDQLDEHFILINGDSWAAFELALFINSLSVCSEYQNKSVIVTRKVSIADRYDVVHSNNKGAVTRITKHGSAFENNVDVNAGIYSFHRDHLSNFSFMGSISLEDVLLSELTKQNQLMTFPLPTNTYFVDIGVPSSLYKAQDEFKENFDKLIN